LSADGSRALISTNPRDYATSTDTTQLAVINMTTGTQIGTTLTFNGYPASRVLPDANGSLALITIGDGSSTRLVVVNTTTGAQTSTFTVTGAPQGSLLMTADGTRALITTATYDSFTTVSTRVTVLRIA
jgi:microcystin-dependent protein